MSQYRGQTWSNYQKANLRQLSGISKKLGRKTKPFWIKMSISESGADAETFEKILLDNTAVGKEYKSGAIKVLVIDDVYIEIENYVAPATTIKMEYQIVSQEKSTMVYIDDQANLLKWVLEWVAVGTPAEELQKPSLISVKNSVMHGGGMVPEHGVIVFRNELWHGIDSDNTSATLKFHLLWQCHYEIWNPINLKNYSDAIA